MIFRTNKYLLILLLSCACLNNGDSKATNAKYSKGEKDSDPHQNAVGPKNNVEDEKKATPVSVFVHEDRNRTSEAKETIGDDSTKTIEEDGNEKSGSVPFMQPSQQGKLEEKVKKQSQKEDEVSMTTNKVAKKEHGKSSEEEEETTQGPTKIAKKVEADKATEDPMPIAREEPEQEPHFEDARTTNKKDKLRTEIEDEKQSPKEKQKIKEEDSKIVPDKKATEEPMKKEQYQKQHVQDTKTSSKEKGPKAASTSSDGESTQQAEAVSNEVTKKQNDNTEENPIHTMYDKGTTKPPSTPTIFLKQNNGNQSETTSAIFIKTEKISANEKTEENKSPTPTSTDLQEEKTASFSSTTLYSISWNNHTNSSLHHASLNSSDEHDEDYPKSFEHVSLEVEEHARKIVEAAAFPKPKSGASSLTAKTFISFALACIAFCM